MNNLRTIDPTSLLRLSLDAVEIPIRRALETGDHASLAQLERIVARLTWLGFDEVVGLAVG